jgi:ComF family protein
MLDRILSLIAPHYCSECDEIGSSLCPGCKYNIVDDKSYELNHRVRVVGTYKGVLGTLIKSLKFDRSVEAAKILGTLLDYCLPDYGKNVIVVPVPTIDTHIRQRGYDHMMLIAREFAKLRNYEISHALKRNSSSVQVGASARQRNEQARNAFSVKDRLDSRATFLIVDDVLTTGATLNYAVRSLRKFGARQVKAVAIAHQTLD